MNDIDLIKSHFDEQRWAVEGVFPEGVTLLAAPAKQGKSFFMLNVACDVAYGDALFGRFPTKQGEVLYLALEDSYLRMQLRLLTLLAARDKEPNGKLHIETDWSKAQDGGAKNIENWLADFPNARLVVIDVLRRYDSIRGYSTEQDYAKIASLGDLASKRHVAIVAVHHMNRQGRRDKDWTERIQGTMGVGAAAHCIMALEGERGDANKTLRFVGKDIADTAIPLAFDADTGRFVIRESEDSDIATIAPLSDERLQIANVVIDNPGFTATEIALKLGKSHANIRMLLWKMKEQGQLRNIGGHYYTPKQAREMKLMEDPQTSFVAIPTAELRLPK